MVNMKKYVTEFTGTAHMYNNLKYMQVGFVPTITIDCNPPYIRGREYSNWISYNPKRRLPRLTDKKGWEKILGMSLLPISE